MLTAPLALLVLMAAAPKATTPLLGGRIAVWLPSPMRVEARGGGIMGAPEAAEDETRAVLDVRGVRFVMMAHELYALAGPDLEAGVRAQLADRWGARASGFKIERLAAAPPARRLGLLPPELEEENEATYVYGAYFGHPDGTVQVLDFYVNKAGRKDPATWARLARSVAESLAPGPRALPSQAGPDHFEDLVMTLPAGFAASGQRGPDFSVHRIRRIGVLGAPAQSCGIYLGRYPAYHHDRAEPAPQIKEVPGKLLGAKVSWHLWTNKTSATVEAMVSHPRERGEIHAFCSAGTAAEVEKLRSVLETLQVSK
jgi:hypothetical protein